MTPITVSHPQETLTPRSRADLARDEQAFYDKHGNAGSWMTALKLLAPIPAVFVLYAAVLELLPAFH